MSGQPFPPTNVPLTAWAFLRSIAMGERISRYKSTHGAVVVRCKCKNVFLIYQIFHKEILKFFALKDKKSLLIVI
jgi:hypothetical protein